ncbi:SDR family NAD(P)-dependent oxidoreductase [Fulvivirga maritima]|uniref:SDR family oxidoreductase n=1 Tax=Fulvivirga maritima TaxID=2904247 RepID=UPI001F1657CE|nr:SDR family NAD(P)-dependent oxidoreductase [Fulvivirga maritima]UII26736.1 SDR family NAD(P)-dependent oxidoreductase [Fulvivirga maritima]
MNLKNNTILITGAGTGMGLAAAKWFSEQGNHVIMTARNEERLKEEASKLKNASYVACDLSDPNQLESLVSAMKTEYPELNMIFLNAGIATNYQLLNYDNAYEISKSEMITNYHFAVYLTHALVPLIANKKESALIITTSGVAFAPDLLHPTYSASKAALHSYIKALRLVLQRQKSSIEVYELMAPLVDSPFSKAVHSDLKVSPEEVIETLVNSIRIQEFEIRPGLTEDIYQTYLRSPNEALIMVNTATGA